MSNDFNLISVVIPTLNGLELVVRSVRSVLTQTFDGVEVIVLRSLENSE
jgi:glycosyltransferase involved in cell wall biosynthesis